MALKPGHAGIRLPLYGPHGEETEAPSTIFQNKPRGAPGALILLFKTDVTLRLGGKQMTNEQIEAELRTATTDERRMTKKIVGLIAESMGRRIWSERGYPTPHQWLVQEFKYSDSAAARQLDAARLLAILPEIAEKIEAGALTLSALSSAQSAIHREEKRTKVDLKDDFKRELVGKLEGLSSSGVGRLLAVELPEVFRKPPESLKPVGKDDWTMIVTFDAEQMAALRRSRELLSHSRPGATWAEVIVHLALAHAKTADPVQRNQRREDRAANATRCPSAAVATSRAVPRSVRDQVLTEAGGACEFLDPRTGARCAGRACVEVDHVLAKALGGTDEVGNLRCLCAQHNRLKAVHDLGPRWASSWNHERPGRR